VKVYEVSTDDLERERVKEVMTNKLKGVATGVLQCKYMNCVVVTVVKRTQEVGDEQTCED